MDMQFGSNRDQISSQQSFRMDDWLGDARKTISPL
jgi:hypothetical protein